jgi:hypothetical protein
VGTGTAGTPLVPFVIIIIAEFRPLMGTALTGIANLLKDSSSHVRGICAKVLSKLSESG